MKLLIASPLRCKYPRTQMRHPDWYVREVERLERRERAAWEHYEAARRSGNAKWAARALSEHAKAIAPIYKLHRTYIEMMAREGKGRTA